MKLVALITLLCISFNVLATPIRELEASFDNYNYSLTVEWDQKDQKFFNDKTDEFLKQISHQFLANGVTKEDINSLLEKKVGNKVFMDAMKLKLSLMPVMNSEELIQFLKSHSDEFYTRGASWTGIEWDTVGLIAGGVVLLGAMIWFLVSYDCAEYDFRRSSDCDSSNCYKKVCVEYIKR